MDKAKRKKRCVVLVMHFFLDNESYYQNGAPQNKFRLERFSIECRKTKTKVTTVANHKGHR